VRASIAQGVGPGPREAKASVGEKDAPSEPGVRAGDLGTRDDHELQLFKEAVCPAALVELEFLSNPRVERELAPVVGSA